jgi:hypothetical protein
VETTPAMLREQIETALQEKAVSARIPAIDSFAPGGPVPTHRYASNDS